jgi:sec-independent protein translocase protein TatC
MLLTPPDVISQTLLALPMWVLFELGLIFSRMFVRGAGQTGDDQRFGGVVATSGTTGDPPVPAGGAVAPAAASAGAGGVTTDVIPPFDGDPRPELGGDAIDPERFVPLTDEELEAELDIIEAEEEEEQAAAVDATDPMEQKFSQAQALREAGDESGARQLLYDVLANGSQKQIETARNILRQLDQD